MAFNLTDQVKNLFNSTLVAGAASSLGETEEGIRKAASGAIPAVLAGLASKAAQPEGAASVLAMAQQAGDSGMLSNFATQPGSINALLEKGASMLRGILGDRAGSIANLIAGYAGIKDASASSLLGMVAPVALGALGSHAAAEQLNANGLMHYMAAQKNTIIQALPAGLSGVASLLGPGTQPTQTAHITQAAHAHLHDAHDAAPDGGRRFLVPLLLGVFAVALGIYLFKGCEGPSKKMATTETSEAAPAAEPAAKPIAGSTRETMQVKLPNDSSINAYSGGIEDKLVAFLKTDYKKLGADSLKNRWFDFDNLNFETGSATITPGSQVQVNNLAAILRAFPAVQLKIGGYTDKVGNEADNKRLSEARAKAVQAALEKAGVGKQIVGAEGYGSAFAIYPADASEEQRIKDRHVSVSVR
ncbi:MAG TPA: OmpA family protein [Chitinophagaceae bacterium]|nr:OmpA family protein [Chitinophagaceae bacterium]